MRQGGREVWLYSAFVRVELGRYNPMAGGQRAATERESLPGGLGHFSEPQLTFSSYQGYQS